MAQQAQHGKHAIDGVEQFVRRGDAARRVDLTQGQKVEQKIDETHTASLGEFELAKEARELNREEISELKKIAREMHTLLQKLDQKN